MATWKAPRSDYTAESQVTPDIFNTLAENEEYLIETKITTEQVQNATVSSTEASTRANILSGDTIKVAFGKLRKWLADLGSLAFKSTVETADIASQAVTTGKLASHAVTYGKIETGAVLTAKIADLAVTAEKIADGAVTDEKIDSVAASKVTGLAKVATSGSYNDLSDKPSFSSGMSLEKVTFEFNKQYNVPATGIYLCYIKFTNSGGYTNIACLGTMNNSPRVTNGSYSGVSKINESGMLNIMVWCESVSTTAVKYHLLVSTSATTVPSKEYDGDGKAELIMYKLGGYATIT